jgi:hypothetical protein
MEPSSSPNELTTQGSEAARGGRIGYCAHWLTRSRTQSLAEKEANVEKADALLQQSEGTDQAQMQGYEDRSKYRTVDGTKYARELILK